MTARLSSQDVSFLYLEGRTTPMHVGSLCRFDRPPDGFDYDALLRLIEARIGLVPRYRQKMRTVPAHLANPLWIDDAHFDITYHVRRSALPKPGSDAQLREFCGRVLSRPLDRNRPLWEMYLVEGLAGGRIALITKTHHAMVDSITSVDLAQVILDVSTAPRIVPEDLWMPEPEPPPTELVADAVRELLRRPGAFADTVRMGVKDVLASGSKVFGAVGDVLAAARLATRPAPASPLNTSIGEQRRLGLARTRLDDYRLVRKLRDVTVNDVVLATVAGALRGWLLFRGEPVRAGGTVRAMVPVSVRSDAESEHVGTRVESYFVDLPVGEPSPLIRLSQVSYGMKAHAESGRSVGADVLAALSGVAPPTLHALGARAANSLTRRAFNVVVTNVPGPQFPLYAGGCRLLEMFPILPLAGGQALSIGLTSYDGGVYYGLNADRDAMEDVDVLASLIEESLAELVAAAEASTGGRGH